MTHVFLINPKVENAHYAAKLRNSLAQLNDFNYFVFNIRYAGYEEILVSRILQYLGEDQLRIYVVGGLGTLHKIVNSLGDHLSDVELAWFPTGKTNNYLRNFKLNPEHFLDMELLIKGKAKPIDYIKTNHGIAINALTLGCDVSVQSLQRRLPSIDTSDRVAVVLRRIRALLLRIRGFISSNPARCRIDIDDNKAVSSGGHFEIIMQNGDFIGLGIKVHESGVLINDGISEYFIGGDFQGLGLVRTIVKLLRKKLNESDVFQTGKCEKMAFTSLSGGPLMVSLDGEIYENFPFWEAEVVKHGINFVIPEGAAIE